MGGKETRPEPAISISIIFSCPNLFPIASLFYRVSQHRLLLLDYTLASDANHSIGFVPHVSAYFHVAHTPRVAACENSQVACGLGKRARIGRQLQIPQDNRLTDKYTYMYIIYTCINIRNTL